MHKIRIYRFLALLCALVIASPSSIWAFFMDLESVKDETNEKGEKLAALIAPFSLYRIPESDVKAPAVNVVISGVVKRPGVYVLSDPSALAALKAAGIITAKEHHVTSGLGRVMVVRSSYEKTKKLFLNLKDASKEQVDFKLQNGDVLIVPGLSF